MTLGRLVGAWLPVAVWCLVATWAARRIATAHTPPPATESPAPAPPARAPGDPVLFRRRVGLTLAEAGVMTLFAALWFDSLGRRGWWLLFLLVGLLVGFPARFERLAARPTPRPDVLLALLDTVRYLGAGAILAWRLR